MTKKNDSNYMSKIEKWIKRSMKKKISISSKVIVAFMITGSFLINYDNLFGKAVQIAWGSIVSEGMRTGDSSVALNPQNKEKKRGEF